MASSMSLNRVPYSAWDVKGIQAPPYAPGAATCSNHLCNEHAFGVSRINPGEEAGKLRQQNLKISSPAVANGTGSVGQKFKSSYFTGTGNTEGTTVANSGRAGLGSGTGRVRRRSRRGSRPQEDAQFLREVRQFLAERGVSTAELPTVRQFEQYGRRDLADGMRIRGGKAAVQQLLSNSQGRSWQPGGGTHTELSTTNGVHQGRPHSVNGGLHANSNRQVDAGDSWNRSSNLNEEFPADEESRKHEDSLRERAALFLATGQMDIGCQDTVFERPESADAAKEPFKSGSSPWSLSEEAVAAQKAALLKARLKRRQADGLQTATVDAPATTSIDQSLSATSSEGNSFTGLPQMPVRESDLAGALLRNPLHGAGTKVYDTSQPFDDSFRLDSGGRSEEEESRQVSSSLLGSDKGVAEGSIFTNFFGAAAPRHVKNEHVSLAASAGARQMAESPSSAATFRASTVSSLAEASTPQKSSMLDSSSKAGTLQESPAAIQRGAENATVTEFPVFMEATEADATIRQLKRENEELFHDILKKQQEIEAMSMREKQLQEEFKVETQRELQRIKDALKSREDEVASMVRELQEAKGQFKLMRAKAMAELAQTQQLLAEKDQRLRTAEKALSNLKRVKVEYWGDGSEIKLAGSFNGWSHFLVLQPDPSSAIPQSDGARGPVMWDAEMYLYPGTYQVKFIVDGVWTLDSRREICTTDMGQNNLIHVKEEDE